MLLKENFTAEHISRLRDETKSDPSILERTVFAFGLLEAITKVGLTFIFKGGTSLLVILNSPKRLSTDIDIIVNPNTDIDAYIEEAGKIFPFISVEENIRKSSHNIEKRHFRFHFLSPRTGKDINVLLDVLFENNPYEDTVKYPIKNKFLLSDNDDLFVKVPNKNCILGDKLTAFAPHTTGILLGDGKELEVVKQLFDCWTLIQEMDDYNLVVRSYNRVSQIELDYRSLSISSSDCLKDTIDSCICIIGRGSVNSNDYESFALGINAIKGHVFSERINGENACIYASEVMYLASCILTGKTVFNRIANPHKYRDVRLKISGMKKISSIRNTNPLSYAYMIKALQMLNDVGLYNESIL